MSSKDHDRSFNENSSNVDWDNKQLNMYYSIHECTLSGTLTLPSSLGIGFAASGLKKLADLKHVYPKCKTKLATTRPQDSEAREKTYIA